MNPYVGWPLVKGTLDTLLECNWIRPRGRRRVPGRPLQWGTSEEFLEYFSLENLNDLPGIEELKATGLLEKRDNLTSLILPDDLPVEEDSRRARRTFPFRVRGWFRGLLEYILSIKLHLLNSINIEEERSEKKSVTDDRSLASL